MLSFGYVTPSFSRAPSPFPCDCVLRQDVNQDESDATFRARAGATGAASTRLSRFKPHGAAAHAAVLEAGLKVRTAVYAPPFSAPPPQHGVAASGTLPLHPPSGETPRSAMSDDMLGSMSLGSDGPGFFNPMHGGDLSSLHDDLHPLYLYSGGRGSGGHNDGE